MVDFKVILGVLGNITAICLFASPIPTFIGIVKKRSVEDYSGVPYVCTLLNCLLWVVYGLPVVKFQVLVVSINTAGAVIEVVYLVLYLTNATRKIRMKVLKILVPALIAFVAVTVLVLELVDDHQKRKLIIGSFCAIFAVGMYSSPLTVMKMVIRTKSVEYMPFLLSLFNFINALVWTAYAFIGGVDIFIAIPNGLGAFAGAAQLALYAFYRNATPMPVVDTDEKGNPMKPANPNPGNAFRIDMEPKHEANGAP